MKFNRKRLGLLLLAILLVASSWIGIATARSGLAVQSLQREGIPLLYLAPQGAKAAPGVLVADGFAGSKQLMLGYGHVLAHAGYAVMLWDFDGHGANGTRLLSPLCPVLGMHYREGGDRMSNLQGLRSEFRDLLMKGGVARAVFGDVEVKGGDRQAMFHALRLGHC